jgi:hypothetical protein
MYRTGLKSDCRERNAEGTEGMRGPYRTKQGGYSQISTCSHFSSETGSEATQFWRRSGATEKPINLSWGEKKKKGVGEKKKLGGYFFSSLELCLLRKRIHMG